jgi:hypothetical protein
MTILNMVWGWWDSWTKYWYIDLLVVWWWWGGWTGCASSSNSNWWGWWAWGFIECMWKVINSETLSFSITVWCWWKWDCCVKTTTNIPKKWWNSVAFWLTAYWWGTWYSVNMASYCCSSWCSCYCWWSWWGWAELNNWWNWCNWQWNKWWKWSGALYSSWWWWAGGVWCNWCRNSCVYCW